MARSTNTYLHNELLENWSCTETSLHVAVSFYKSQSCPDRHFSSIQIVVHYFDEVVNLSFIELCQYFWFQFEDPFQACIFDVSSFLCSSAQSCTVGPFSLSSNSFSHAKSCVGKCNSTVMIVSLVTEACRIPHDSRAKSSNRSCEGILKSVLRPHTF
jgi:hypothetical protein